jgi:hypothetical protein
MKIRRLLRLSCLCCIAAALFSCTPRNAIVEKSSVTALPLPELTPRGTLVFNDEYEFTPPPEPWEVFKGTQTTHYIVGFYRKDPDTSQLASTFFAYDENPYGFSRNLEERAKECLKRYFWASILEVTVLEQKKVRILGGEGLAVTFEGTDTVKKIKVKSKVLFGHRGERVVAFYINQWRSLDGSYDDSVYVMFDKFVNSFRFLKKSFYETL